MLANEPGGLPSLFTVVVSATTPGFARQLVGIVNADSGPDDPDLFNNSAVASFEVLADELLADGFED